MIQQANPYLRYQQTKIETSSPLQLVIMLYDGAIRFAHQAQKAIEKKDIQQTNYNLQRAQDIVDELTVTLNPDAGEISQNLARLYEYVSYSLVQANLNKDSQMIENAVSVLTTLRSAWAELRPTAPRAVGDN